MIGGLLLAAGSVGEAPQPDGCWSIKDQIERLACFDEAVGPPGPGITDARPAPTEPVLDPATMDPR